MVVSPINSPALDKSMSSPLDIEDNPNQSLADKNPVSDPITPNREKQNSPQSTLLQDAEPCASRVEENVMEAIQIEGHI